MGRPLDSKYHLHRNVGQLGRLEETTSREKPYPHDDGTLSTTSMMAIIYAKIKKIKEAFDKSTKA